jgi:hypothetical protein
MINRRKSPPARRLLGLASLLVATASWFVLSGGAPAEADDGGLLSDPATTTILEGATQAVEPVVQTAASAVSPLEQAVAPTVQQAVPPAVTAAEEALEPAVTVAEEAVAPGSRALEADVHHTVDPAVEAVEPVVEPVAVPAEPQAPVVRGPNSNHPVEGTPPSGAPVVDTGATVRAAQQIRSKTTDAIRLTDLPPRATSRTWFLDDHAAGADHDEGSTLWALTNALMHHYAGDPLPGSFNAGLDAGPPPRAARVHTHWAAPLLLVLLGLLCLALSRRRLA